MTVRFAALGGVLLALSCAPVLAQQCREDLALIRTDTGLVSIEVEIADDPAERAQGLMWRKDLPERHGMLFIYESPQRVEFWMQNTLIPLDMLFIDATGVIRRIHPQAIPHDQTGIPGADSGDPDPGRLMVLEIAGGDAAKLGIAEGDTLAHPRLPQPGAAFPCN